MKVKLAAELKTLAARPQNDENQWKRLRSGQNLHSEFKTEFPAPGWHYKVKKHNFGIKNCFESRNSLERVQMRRDRWLEIVDSYLESFSPIGETTPLYQ